MLIKDLQSISILGLGLLGGSLGLAVNRIFPHVKRVGYSHREVTLQKALEAGTVDKVYSTAARAVSRADLVVLAGPIGVFPELMKAIAPSLNDGVIVTDVGSTKLAPQRWANKYLPDRVEFLGSHPMAGSEQRGVDFARADLFDQANCILGTTAKTSSGTYNFLKEFWEALGMRVSHMSPTKHDQVLSRISHLPHILAAALVNASNLEETMLCGKGFLDTTRIASGAPSVWHDILMENSVNTDQAIARLVKELTKIQRALRENNGKALTKMLTRAQEQRDTLVARKLRRKELPE